MSDFETWLGRDAEASRTEELQKWVDAWSEARGTDVGNMQNTADATQKEKSEKSNGNKDATKSVMSPEDMQKELNAKKETLNTAKAENPDWPASAENPESAKAEQAALESSLNRAL